MQPIYRAPRAGALSPRPLQGPDLPKVAASDEAPAMPTTMDTERCLHVAPGMDGMGFEIRNMICRERVRYRICDER
jgi:hypothetical protein